MCAVVSVAFHNEVLQNTEIPLTYRNKELMSKTSILQNFEPKAHPIWQRFKYDCMHMIVDNATVLNTLIHNKYNYSNLHAAHRKEFKAMLYIIIHNDRKHRSIPVCDVFSKQRTKF